MDPSLRQMVDAVLMAGRPVPRRTAGSAWPDDRRGGEVAHLLRSLRDRHDWRGGAGKRALTAAKYLARSVLMFRGHADYLHWVESEPALQAFRRRDPRMQERHFHRYLNLGWNRRQRLQAIRHHYRHLLATMPTPLFRAIHAEGGAPLGVLAVKSGSRLILSLRPPIFLGCEGELCIQLGDERGNPLYRVVVTATDERTLAIGCIQGPDGTEAREAVRELTRQLHGLRPKCLMLALACALARHWGLARLLAVGNAAHPLRNARRRFVADYDAFWLEQQGTDVGDGWYELPVQPERKSVAEVPSQHRSAFRKREALRMEAERLLVEALGAMPERHRLRAQPSDPSNACHPFQGIPAEAS